MAEGQLDVALDYESLHKVGAMVGSGGIVVMDEDTCIGRGRQVLYAVYSKRILWKMRAMSRRYKARCLHFLRKSQTVRALKKTWHSWKKWLLQCRTELSAV